MAWGMGVMSSHQTALNFSPISSEKAVSLRGDALPSASAGRNGAARAVNHGTETPV